MRRILLTGMSGTGTSTLVRELVARSCTRSTPTTPRCCSSRAARRTERDRTLRDVATVQPLLRRVADHEVVATAALPEVVAEVLRVTGVDPSRA